MVDPAPDTPAGPASRVWTIERVAQMIVLLIGGGIGGVIATLATNALEWRKLTQQAEVQNAAFVERYLRDVVDKDIYVRFRIAEYYGSVLESESQRNLWKAYLSLLNKNYDELDYEYRKQLEAIDPDSSELKNFHANRRLKRIESYLGEVRDLKIKPAPSSASEIIPAPDASPRALERSDYQVFTQFAGSLQRAAVKTMMQALADEKWNMQGLDDGGERTPAAAGANEIRYGAVDDKAAADELAKAVQKSGLTSRSVVSSFTIGIRPKALEIWISK